ncbi:MAG: two-CW domain-containing protein [Desulfobulbaceae bacterium]
MTKVSAPAKDLNDVIMSLRKFIDLTLEKDERNWAQWISATAAKISIKCWEVMECHETNCPAYKNECRRCWLIAGTMCGGTVQGHYAKKYRTCTRCRIFRESVFIDPLSEIQEHILILVHNLRAKQHDLQLEQDKLRIALSEIKTLRGLIPICASCKKIRDDKGVWNQIECYIRDHSEAEFSHGICPECAAKLYPNLKLG